MKIKCFKYFAGISYSIFAFFLCLENILQLNIILQSTCVPYLYMYIEAMMMNWHDLD